MSGRIVQISVSRGGVPKTTIEQAHVTALGLEGVTRLPVDEFEVVLKSTRPSQVRTIFGQRFQYMKSWGIPAIIPPNYLASIVRLAGSLRIPWENLDGRVNSRWPFRSLGSHVAYLFRARPES